jgi:hypothetical protein
LTFPKPLKFEKKSRDYETIFLNHYDWLCVLIVMGLAYRRTPGVTKLQATAGSILAQSRERDAGAVLPHGAIHELFSLEIRSAQGNVISSAEVESLRSADRPVQTLRLRAPNGNVLASHWIDVSGKVQDFSKTESSKPGITLHAINAQNRAWQAWRILSRASGPDSGAFSAG